MTSDESAATRGRPRVALITCSRFPDLYDDEFPLRDALVARGVDVDTPVWDDLSVDWSVHHLAVLRSTWDYPERIGEFLAWTRTVAHLANPAEVVAWNTDKRYLRDLAAAGLPVTPTTFAEPGDRWQPGSSGEWVVKPTVSAGSKDTGRYRFPDEAHLAADHVARLHAAGRVAMIQPYLTAVDSAGETALLYTAGPDGGLGFSHAIRKGPLLTGPDLGDKAAEYREDISPREPTADELAVGERVVAALPGGLLYARVDLIPGPDGAPTLVEVELTEPSLFWRHTGPAAVERMADAIMARIS